MKSRQSYPGQLFKLHIECHDKQNKNTLKDNNKFCVLFKFVGQLVCKFITFKFSGPYDNLKSI